VLVQHARINALDKGALLMQLCSKWLYGAQNRGSRNCESQILMFAKQFMRPCQSRRGAHGMCHACHTLDTPLEILALH